MSKRLTRKQIKEDIRHDEVQTALSSTFDRIQENQQLVIGVLAAIIVLAIGFAVTRSVMAQRAETAAVDLAKAMKVYNAPIDAEDAKPDDPDGPSFASDDDRRARSKEAMESVSGGTAEDLAGLYLADLALESGDTAAAREHWETFLESHEGHILAVSVRLNLIRLDRDEGKADEVAEELLAELESGGSSLPEDVLLFELAETLDSLERGDEAQEYYQRILDDHPQSPYTAQAREKTSS